MTNEELFREIVKQAKTIVAPDQYPSVSRVSTLWISRFRERSFPGREVTDLTEQEARRFARRAAQYGIDNEYISIET